MRFQIFLLCLLAGVFSTQALAGVGQTSAGVTTTVGNQNDPSADVQQQSSGFVQQNQQLANGQPTPGAGASASGAAAAGTAAGAQNGNKANTNIVNGVPVGVPVAVPPPAPATPPPPPPVYESAMHRLDRHTEPTPTVIASGPPGAVRKQEVAEPTKPDRPTSAPAPVVKSAATAPAVARTDAATAAASPERLTPPAITGGRGEAPDGFTFYSGVSIAGALLAFAFATFLRMGRSDGTQ